MGPSLAPLEPTQFRLQFPVEQAHEYASRFAYAEDDEMLAIGQAARERGHYTLAEFARACRWKTPRSAPHVARNTARSVEQATTIALDEAGGERERISALLSLHGVGWPTASVLLHLAYTERYPILDQRALQALGWPRPPSYGFRFWEAYLSAWRALLAQSGIGGRAFDQALWQWSKEQGLGLV
jgi:hypothetical protein